MPIFLVETKEVWTRLYKVEADGPAKALLYVREGEETPEDDSLEYQHTLHPNQWTLRDTDGHYFDPEKLL